MSEICAALNCTEVATLNGLCEEHQQPAGVGSLTSNERVFDEEAYEVIYDAIYDKRGTWDEPLARIIVRALRDENLIVGRRPHEPRAQHPIVKELRAVDNRPDFAQIYLRHLCLRAADVIEGAAQPPREHNDD